MHISEGVLRPEILAAGALVGAAWIGTLFYKLEARQIPLKIAKIFAPSPRKI